MTSFSPGALACWAILGFLVACTSTTDQGATATGLSEGSDPSAQSLPASSAVAPPLDEDSFAEEMLSAHNRWRNKYGVPPLVWSDELASFAEEWAREISPDGLRLRHRPDNPYGENLYALLGRSATAAEVVDTWGAEEELYDPELNNWWPKAAHFSQMIWRTTRRVGCAAVRSGDTEHWVCNYDPPGNVRGRRPY